MDIAQIRYANLRLLIDREGGLNSGGLTRVAEKLGKSQGQLSHVGGAKPIKNIGSRLARQIEEVFELERGWMDVSHTSGVREPATVSYLPSQPTGRALETMALAAEVTRFWIDLHGLQGTVEDHIPLLAIAHELVLESRGQATVLDLSKKLAARLREETSDDDDERGPAAGSGRAGGAVRGKPAGGRKGPAKADRS